VVRGVSVVTATYCERENIRPLVERIRGALEGVDHEVIVVDDTSPDGTYEEAAKWADRVLLMKRAGQTRCLLEGINAARYPVVVTLDADLENPPELVPEMLEAFEELGADLLVASRTFIPRVSERLASVTIGRIVGVRDVFSNFRVYRHDRFAGYRLRMGETFGGELLAYAWLSGYKIVEYQYEPPPRRAKPRIGGSFKANARILKATAKMLAWMTVRKLFGPEERKKELI
jgi:dolichol-phosphate mannosyltransferase